MKNKFTKKFTGESIDEAINIILPSYFKDVAFSSKKNRRSPTYSISFLFVNNLFSTYDCSSGSCLHVLSLLS